MHPEPNQAQGDDGYMGMEESFVEGMPDYGGRMQQEKTKGNRSL
jgi:hypothetical protein